jgi:5-methylcytosine-specific restriction endonuclease McrA
MYGGANRVAHHEVLVLNSNYEPLNVCTMRRAIALLLLGKADVLEHRTMPIATTRGFYDAPSVLRMRYQVRRPMPQLRLSRHSVLARDNYTCQYCGVRNKELTIDHVIPRWTGGPHTWDNLVACCRRCNLYKGDKTPQQAKMKLARRPKRPHFIPYLSLPTYLRARTREEWAIYLPQFDEVGVGTLEAMAG